MLRKVVLFGGIFGAIKATSLAAFACGGGALTTTHESAGVVADSQRVFMSVRWSNTTDIVVQIGVPATTADYGVLIPVPDEPVLDPEPIAAVAFEGLDRATAPTIAVTETDYSGGGDGDDDGGCGCLMGSSESAGVKDGTVPRGDTKEGADVAVTAPQNIGPVTAVVLNGENSDAVDAWLDEHGFVLPDDSRGTFEAYAGPGKYFIAVKRSEAAQDGAPSSVGLHYVLPGDHRDLSLGFARIGAAHEVAFTVFLSVPSATFAPSVPFRAITLDSLSPELLRNASYRSAVFDAVARNDSVAFLLEGSWGKPWPTQNTPFADLMDDNAVLTRLSTVIASSKLGPDVNFGTPYFDSVPRERTVSATRLSTTRYASFGWVAALLLGGALRRRLRPARA
jgi:hypothetical protein